MESKVKVCPDCLSENDIEAKFCNTCGYDFQSKSENEFDIDIFYDIDDLIDDAILVFKGESYKESLDLIDEYLEDFPEDEIAWTFKSHVLSKLGFTKDAVTCCNVALNINDMSQIAWTSKAYHFYLQKNYDAALSCCQTVLILDSEDDYIKKLMQSISYDKDINEL